MRTEATREPCTPVARQFLQLHLTRDIGPVRARKLLDHFGSLDAILHASVSELQRVEGIGARTAEAIFASRCDETVEREVERAAACGARIVCIEDDDYPRALRSIYDPPMCLYIRGRVEPADCVAMAVVGKRQCSHYGREQAMRFGELLAGAGFTVVSGLARGIDGSAHRGALQGKGRTLAVLGNGLASIYPLEHAELAEDIAQSGALLSELPMDTAATADHFPRRNRIIAGLSLGVLVIEAGPRSGAQITARLANEYNREVFALPGRVDHPEFSAGVNDLIRKGEAKLVTCLEDILDELGDVGRIMGATDSPTAAGPSARRLAEDLSGSEAPASRPAPVSPDGSAAASGSPDRCNLTPAQRAVWSAVRAGAEDVDRIAMESKLEAAQVLAALTSLQLKGLVRQRPGHQFSARRVDGPSTDSR